MKEQNELFKEYKNLQQELGNKREQLSNLYRRKTELEQAKQQSVELTGIYQQIKNFNSEISKLEPTVLSLQKQHENLVIEANNITAINQNIIQQTIINQGKNQELSDLFSLIDSTLSELSNFTGQQIDTTAMVVKNIPKTELTNSKAMLEVCEKKSKEAFNEILSKLDNINASDKDDITLLMYSLKHGFWYGVDRLLDMGADVNVTNKAGHNALMYACIMPRLKYILKIAEQTLDINQTSNEGNSALFYLCRSLGYIYSSEKVEELKEYDVSNTTIVLDSDLAVSVTEGKKGINFGGMSWSLSDEGGGGGIMFSMSYASGDVYSVIMSSELIQLKGSALEYKTSKLIDYFIEREATINANCQQGLTPLYIACAAKNKYLVKYLISKGASLSVIDDNGYDGFMWLSEIKDFDGMEQLLDQGVDINRQDKNGKTLLFWMIQYGWADVAKFLLDHNANPNIPNNANEYPLGFCVSANNKQMLELLTTYSATDLNARSLDFKVTPLWLAAQDGKEELLDLLLSKNSDPNLPRTDNGQSPLLVALQKGHWSIFNKLSTHHKVDIKSVDKNGQSILHYGVQLNNSDIIKFAVSKGINIDLGDANGNTGFYLACLSGNIQIAKFLKEQGANINILNTGGFHPIHGAVHNGRIDTIEKLIEWGVEVDKKSTNGYTPLQYYSQLKNAKLDVVKYLHSKGADFNCTFGQYADTLLHTAVVGNNQEILLYLLDKGMDINATLNIGHTPLLTACELNNLEIVKILINNGVDLHKTANKGETAMQYACGYGSVELVKYLENLGATIEQKSNMDCDGVHEAFYTSNLAVIDYLNEREFDFNYKSTVEHKTPLHYLLENKNISSEKKIFVIQKYLHRLDTTITDNEGKTPLDYAKEYCPETISYLSEHHQDTMILNIDLVNDDLPLAGDHFDAHSHDYS